MAEFNKTVFENGTGEIVEKKSRFIADIRYAETEEEALKVVEEVRKKHYDARHNCFAYVLGSKGETLRASDDGEPSGTAGRPMLDILTGEGIYNVVAVVTRYFGGTLLGTGGLVRAYSGAMKEALANAVLIEKKTGTILSIDTDYTGLGKIQYLLGQNQIPTLSTDYTDAVHLEVIVPAELVDRLMDQITNAVNGQGKLEKLRTCNYAEVDGEVILE